MLSLTALFGIVMATISCYLAGCILAGVLYYTKLQQLKLSAGSSEQQLRAEIRDLVSLILLDIAEQGENPSAARIIERCPDYLKTGKSWEIWVHESHIMSMF